MKLFLFFAILAVDRERHFDRFIFCFPFVLDRRHLHPL